MKVADFDYQLPPDRIAQTPLEPRDHSKLMVVSYTKEQISHKYFYDLADYLTPNDVLVINETRVIPARLYGTAIESGGKMEFLLLRPLTDNRWEILVKPGKRAKIGRIFDFGGKLQAKIISETDVGGRIVEFIYEGVFEDVLAELGEMPLPPYITEQLTDKERYQTVYSKEQGSVAAPTAGLHFTQRLIDQIEAMGVPIIPLVLHVGVGTFRPVQVDDVADHKMHAEFYRLSEENAQKINACKVKGGRVIAIGTTVVRTLETLAVGNSCVKAGSGWTDIFIYPGYQFQIVDALVTNFHLPKSSLLMLVSAFAGSDMIQRVYKEALRGNYRFFSFGDAMLLQK